VQKAGAWNWRGVKLFGADGAFDLGPPVDGPGGHRSTHRMTCRAAEGRTAFCRPGGYRARKAQAFWERQAGQRFGVDMMDVPDTVTVIV
jgi:hypothetical protein